MTKKKAKKAKPKITAWEIRFKLLEDKVRDNIAWNEAHIEAWSRITMEKIASIERRLNGKEESK